MAIRFAAITGLVILASFACFGQAESGTEFDAASIKPAKPGDIRGSLFQFTVSGGLEVSNATLKSILETAYDVRDFQIAGGPPWIDADRYYVSARSAAGGSIAETRKKLQKLLAERFRLAVHRESKELPLYVLSVAKSGWKLSPARELQSGVGTGIQMTCGRMSGRRASMANLATYLERRLRRPVRDQSELPGRYDFDLEWMPDPGSCSASPVEADLASDGASLFTALQETLGLKLEATKGPVEVIVVDHAERPEPNRQRCSPSSV